MPDAHKPVTIYTDGGCDPNPGPGGYGVVLYCPARHTMYMYMRDEAERSTADSLLSPPHRP